MRVEQRNEQGNRVWILRPGILRSHDDAARCVHLKRNDLDRSNCSRLDGSYPWMCVQIERLLDRRRDEFISNSTVAHLLDRGDSNGFPPSQHVMGYCARKLKSFGFAGQFRDHCQHVRRQFILDEPSRGQLLHGGRLARYPTSLEI